MDINYFFSNITKICFFSLPYEDTMKKTEQFISFQGRVLYLFKMLQFANTQFVPTILLLSQYLVVIFFFLECFKCIQFNVMTNVVNLHVKFMSQLMLNKL